jgi:hypothetical protein
MKTHTRTPQIASIEKDYMLFHHNGSPCHGWYWTGMILLFFLGFFLFFGCLFSCIAVQQKMSMSSAATNGEQLPLLAAVI